MHSTENCTIESAAHQSTTSETDDIYWRKGKSKGKGKGKGYFPFPKGKGKSKGKGKHQPRRNLFEEVDVSSYGTLSHTSAKVPAPMAAAAATGSGSMAGDDSTSSGLHTLGISENSQQDSSIRRLSLFDLIEDVPKSKASFTFSKPATSKDSSVDHNQTERNVHEDDKKTTCKYFSLFESDSDDQNELGYHDGQDIRSSYAKLDYWQQKLADQLRCNDSPYTFAPKPTRANIWTKFNCQAHIL